MFLQAYYSQQSGLVHSCPQSPSFLGQVFLKRGHSRPQSSLLNQSLISSARRLPQSRLAYFVTLSYPQRVSSLGRFDSLLMEGQKENTLTETSWTQCGCAELRQLIGRMRWSSELCELTFAKTNFWKVIEIEIMREWSHSKTVTHVLQMLSYFKTVFKTKRVLCCVTCCVTIMDSKVKYIWYHRPTLVFFLSFIPFEVSKFSFAPRAFVYNISWSWQRESRQSKVYVKTN